MHDRYVVNICPVGLKEYKKIYWNPSQAVVSCDPAFMYLYICASVVSLGFDYIFGEVEWCNFIYLFAGKFGL
jgi:hypothetical protein